MSAIIGILIGVLVVVRVIGRQVTGSLVTQKALFLMPLILLGFGALSLATVLHTATTGELAFLVLEGAVLIGLGVARGASVRLTPTDQGPFQKGTAATLVLWLLTIAFRIGTSLAAAALWPHNPVGQASIALTVGLTIAAQSAMIYRRSLAMTAPFATQRA